MNAMETEIGSDVEIIEALDFESQQPCCQPGCDGAGVWCATCRACGAPWIYCLTHWGHLKSLATHATWLKCDACGKWSRSPLDEGFWVLPVGGSL